MKLVECPRDAMQGMADFIPTVSKIAYINQLLKVGFDVIDFGSFVSPKAIPQMRDTADVLKGLQLDNSSSKLLTIIANKRGATDASSFDEVSYLGYPFSISETFQMRNTNASIEESLGRVEEIQQIATLKGRKVVVYISMAFGNPYGDPWSPDLAARWIEQLNKKIGIEIFALADTVGVSNVKTISQIFKTVIPAFENLEIGAHLHSTPEQTRLKLKAAIEAGCTRFDSAIAGLGGCPMAEDELVGNVATEQLIELLSVNDKKRINQAELFESMRLAELTFQ